MAIQAINIKWLFGKVSGVWRFGAGSYLSYPRRRLSPPAIRSKWGQFGCRYLLSPLLVEGNIDPFAGAHVVAENVVFPRFEVDVPPLDRQGRQCQKVEDFVDFGGGIVAQGFVFEGDQLFFRHPFTQAVHLLYGITPLSGGAVEIEARRRFFAFRGGIGPCHPCAGESP